MLDWLQTKSVVLAVLMVSVLVLTACGESDDPPPTELVIIPGNTAVVGDRPELEETIVAMQATNFALQSTLIAIQSGNTTVEVTAGSTSENVEVATNASVSGGATPTPAPTETLPPSAFPTPRVEIITVVEQVFEKGRMLWFRESRRVWVLVGDNVDPDRGEWLCYEDTYLDSEIEFDPEFNPAEGTTTLSTFPDAVVQQPIRGFGKLWRENDDLRDRVDWALASEVEHSARRDYIAGGTLDDNDEYVAGPGEWRIQSFYGGTFVLLEDEAGSSCPSGTWRLRQLSN
jgi:hypothetical protein